MLIAEKTRFLLIAENLEIGTTNSGSLSLGCRAVDKM